MIHYLNPKVDTPKVVRGLDSGILKVQMKLAELGWLEKVFGRALMQRRAPGEGEGARDIFYPESLSSGEPINLMPNDNLISYCFFHPVDPLKVGDYEAALEIPSEQTIDIIFWGNLDRLQLPDVEHLRWDAMMHLSKTSSFRITESFLDWPNVFSPFTVTETFKRYLKYPFFGFKIRGVLSFNYKNVDCYA